MAKGKTLNARIVAFLKPRVKDGQVTLRTMLHSLDTLTLSFDLNTAAALRDALQRLLEDDQARTARTRPPILKPSGGLL